MVDPLHSPKFTAAALGVSVKTLNGFVRDGEIRYIDVGRGKKKIRRRFTDQDIEEFKERRARREVSCQSTSPKTAQKQPVLPLRFPAQRSSVSRLYGMREQTRG
jgi:hypothetical protein